VYGQRPAFVRGVGVLGRAEGGQPNTSTYGASYGDVANHPPPNRPRPTPRTRHPARALNVVVFMHPCARRQAAPLLGWLVENGCMKVMRIHAGLCTSARYA